MGSPAEALAVLLASGAVPSARPSVCGSSSRDSSAASSPLSGRGSSSLDGTTPNRCGARGNILIEVLIALLIFGFVATAFMGGIYTTRTSSEVVNEQIAAESLVKSELEYVKDTPYWSLGFSYQVPGSPPPWDGGRTDLDSPYSSYLVSVSGRPVDASTHNALPGGLDQGMQLIEVQVLRGDRLLLATSTLKVNR